MNELMTAASQQTGFGKGTCIVVGISTLMEDGNGEAFGEVQRGFLALLTRRHVRAGGSTEIQDPEEWQSKFFWLRRNGWHASQADGRRKLDAPLPATADHSVRI